MNYANIKLHDVANGPGVRVSLFVSGCNHHCVNCFNQETWDFSYGQLFTDDTMNQILEAIAPSYIKGLSILGGEPFEYVNQRGILPLVRKVRALYPEKDIWCYTGYDYENEIKCGMMDKWPATRELISMIDVLVDGRYVDELRDLKLRFRGSSNQRLIDLKKSEKEGRIVLWEDEHFH